VCRGGILIINLFNLPSAIRLNFSAIFLWCAPSINSGQTCLTKVRKSLFIFVLFCFSDNFKAYFKNSFLACDGTLYKQKSKVTAHF
jgi:hypothetical protein